MKHRKKHIWASIMILLIVAFDQVTKRLAESALMGGKIVTLLPGAVQLRYARNTGMAFSLFSGARWVFVALTALVCAGVLFYMFRNKCRSLWGYWSLGVLVAGGLGNLIDRVLYGYVIDFIEPTFMQFAVFNIADCAVTCGGISFVLWLAVDLFRSGDGKKGTTHDGKGAAAGACLYRGRNSGWGATGQVFKHRVSGFDSVGGGTGDRGGWRTAGRCPGK